MRLVTASSHFCIIRKWGPLVISMFCPFSREKNWHVTQKSVLNMASGNSQIDKTQHGCPKRAELPYVNINTGAQCINTERASLKVQSI